MNQQVDEKRSQLIKLTQSWAMRGKFDEDDARKLRSSLILQNHTHYLGQIPVYAQFAREEGIEEVVDVETIKT